MKIRVLKNLCVSASLRENSSLFVDLLLLAAIEAFMMCFLDVRYLFYDTIVTGGDTASWQGMANHLLTELLPHGRLTGWDMGNFCGYPNFSFYFLPPFLLAALPSWLLQIPLTITLKFAIASGIFLFPVTTYLGLRNMGYRFPGPIIGAAASLLLLFNEPYTMFGGNVLSTLTGEFCLHVRLRPLRMVHRLPLPRHGERDGGGQERGAPGADRAIPPLRVHPCGVPPDHALPVQGKDQVSAQGVSCRLRAHGLLDPAAPGLPAPLHHARLHDLAGVRELALRVHGDRYDPPLRGPEVRAGCLGGSANASAGRPWQWAAWVWPHSAASSSSMWAGPGSCWARGCSTTASTSPLSPSRHRGFGRVLPAALCGPCHHCGRTGGRGRRSYGRWLPHRGWRNSATPSEGSSSFSRFSSAPSGSTC